MKDLERYRKRDTEIETYSYLATQVRIGWRYRITEIDRDIERPRDGKVERQRDVDSEVKRHGEVERQRDVEAERCSERRDAETER